MNSTQRVGCSKPWVEGMISVFLLLTLSLTTAATASAQKKKKKDDTQPASTTSAVPSVPDEQKIDYLIGEMLAAWQLGDIDKMHKTMADDVSVVAGTWSPPAVGWTNYLAAYQVQKARMQQVRMERSNTLIRVAPSGMVAWACYQWDFSAVVDGSPSAAQGQTTLILEKRADNWIIVHNHTSLVQAYKPAAPASTPAQPAQTPATP